MPFVVDLPLPVAELGKNSRVATRTRRRYQAEHREWGRLRIRSELCGLMPRIAIPMVMDIIWVAKSKGHWPDDDNAIARCSAYRDAAQDAGLIENDFSLRIGRVEYLEGDPRVILRFTPDLAGADDGPDPEPITPAWVTLDLIQAIERVADDLDVAMIERDSIDDLVGAIGMAVSALKTALDQPAVKGIPR
jgi:hypothetical protein